jgi:MoaA/NifB/PqqE/SkfB family radical SAM enzyme
MARRQWLAERPSASVPSDATPAAGRGAEPPHESPALPPGSLRARAFEAVAHIGATLGLTAGLAPDDPSRLAIHLTNAQDEVLTLVIERAQADGRYYRRCGDLGFWYRSERQQEGSATGWVATLLTAVETLLTSSDLGGLADELGERPASISPSTESHPTERIEAVSADQPEGEQSYARTRVLGADDVEHFFHVDYQFEAGTDVDQPPTTRIGIIYQCNQPCTFCQLAEMNTHIPPARVRAALEASRARGARRVILTGGEPTLCRDLLDYVGYARQLGYTTIELQTNATLLDKAERAVGLRQAGLTDAQVSLHGPDSDISDRLTAAPGTHQRTLAGIGNLLDAGVRVLLNHLIFRDNCHLLLDFVDMVERRWGPHRERLIMQFHSPLNEFARQGNAHKHIARYSEYASQLRRAIDRGRALGYWVKDLQDPTGIPALCVLGVDSAYLGPILSQRIKPRFHRWESGWMTRVAACKCCEIADACMGIPKGYVELFGDEEFRSIRLAELS